ncbi:hypothetical protein DCS_03629 [Drechmeria coniospora]|uniref:Uncharacterized protein n=1 Tax=Drechmeria coniospora TaxID=98403 RepID=A0A151GHM0_DRECN|nr:hypothetical protein DCS_03629 [Drechmeria coniospora]KYK56627.1 hypothetical protein DCS_03629 [Drechmeria coniospora]
MDRDASGGSSGAACDDANPSRQCNGEIRNGSRRRWQASATDPVPIERARVGESRSADAARSGFSPLSIRARRHGLPALIELDHPSIKATAQRSTITSPLPRRAPTSPRRCVLPISIPHMRLRASACMYRGRTILRIAGPEVLRATHCAPDGAQDARLHRAAGPYGAEHSVPCLPACQPASLPDCHATHLAVAVASGTPSPTFACQSPAEPPSAWSASIVRIAAA